MIEQGTIVERKLLAGILVAGVKVGVDVDGHGGGLGGRSVCRRVEVIEPADGSAETEVERELAHV